MQILFEVAQRVYMGYDFPGESRMIAKYIVEFHRWKIRTGHQIEKFPERISPQIIRVDNILYGRFLFFQTHHRRARKNNIQIGISTVAIRQLFGPCRILEYLIDQEATTTQTIKFIDKIRQFLIGKIEIIKVDI